MNDGKKRLLCLQRILREETDEEHLLNAAQLAEKLAKYGIEAERKTVYSDLEALGDFSFDIVSNGKNGVFLAGREFQTVELRLLVDAVACSKFITERKSNELIKKIGALSSKYNAEKLRRTVIVAQRAKTLNERVYITADAISTAIAEKRKLTFRYFDLDIKRRKVYRHNGEVYTISPYSLAWDDEKYYCIGLNPHYRSISGFRVDKMDNVKISEEKAEAAPDSFSAAEYSRRRFSMFSGETQTVTLCFDNAFIGAVLDKFGHSAVLVPAGEGKFTVCAEVVISPAFYSWLFTFGAGANIVSPVDVKKEYIERLRETMKFVEGD